jgi:hypothetical protein
LAYFTIFSRPGKYTIKVSRYVDLVTHDPNSEVVESNILAVTVPPAADPPPAR